MKIGIGIGLTTRQGVSGEPPIITATVAPSLGPLEDGDTIASAMSANYDQASNYSSAAGTISTVVAAATVNGVAALFADTVDAGDVVAVTVTVTDSEANERVFNAGSRTVADVAPVASGAIADQSYTEGLEITPLDVSEDFTGTRLTFALAPSSAALPAGLSLSSAGVISGTPTTVAAEVNIVVRATNSAGTADTAFGVTIAEASALDPDAAAYISAVETADGEALEEGVKTAINDFVVGCKADAIWTAIKASCILAGARTLSGALVPLAGAAPTNVNFVSADYNRKTGLKGDGATKYLNSNRNNNADPQNSQHLAAYVMEQPNAGDPYNYIYLGTTANQTGSSVLGRSGDGARLLFAQSRRGANYEDPTSPAVTGFHGKSRSNSAGFDVRASGANASQSSASTTPRNENISVFASGTTNYALNRLSFYSIGEALDLAALDTRVSALMTALDGAIA